ncbi:MAG: hypothetical protein QOJ30_2586 [Pseudonocardiales bacterium]|jgi:hypothetical protein|nr:hypothetical protein [Pseudonocardia sp.]MDT7700261.1 hypothetical protein [Pseudonocardiales bacterium]
MTTSIREKTTLTAMDVVTSVRGWLVHGSATPMQEAFICRDAVESILPDAPAGRPRSPRASPLLSTYVAWRTADTAGAGAAAVLVACPSRVPIAVLSLRPGVGVEAPSSAAVACEVAVRARDRPRHHRAGGRRVFSFPACHDTRSNPRGHAAATSTRPRSGGADALRP